MTFSPCFFASEPPVLIKGTCGVRLPAHLGHEFLQGYATLALEQLNHPSGFLPSRAPFSVKGLDLFFVCVPVTCGRSWREGRIKATSILSAMSSTVVVTSLDPLVFPVRKVHPVDRLLPRPARLRPDPE